RQVLDVVVPLSHRVLEVHGRVGLGLVALERDRLTEAREQVGRARELTAGESWAGLAGRLELAEAALRAAEGDLSGSEALFALAVDCFRRRAVPWDEAEALLYWGRALARTDDSLRARERMDDALAVYEQIAAAEPWRAKVRAERVLLG
ncbi:MAG TPA: hypothetical protein VF180_09810, partial [Acidimicrobiia bacterium]